MSSFQTCSLVGLCWVGKMNKVAKRVAARHAKRAYLIGAPTQVHVAQSVLLSVLSSMVGVRMIHWTAHWTAKGEGFYGDHELFMRLYRTMTPEIDQLAEKCVGMFGSVAVDPFNLVANESQHIDRFKSLDDVYKRSLAAEEDLQVTLRTCYDVLKQMNAMSLGLDDYIMSVANTHETHTYLLQQRIASEGGRPGIEKPPYDFSLVGAPSTQGDLK